jgi:hypothetical protein
LSQPFTAPEARLKDGNRPLGRTIEIAARPVTLQRPAVAAVVDAVDAVMLSPVLQVA